jgi:hypothetical protein
LIEIVVEVFEVLKVKLLADNHLVHAADEVALQEAAFIEGFADCSSNKLKVTDVIWLHV